MIIGLCALLYPAAEGDNILTLCHVIFDVDKLKGFINELTYRLVRYLVSVYLYLKELRCFGTKIECLGNTLYVKGIL